MAQQHPSHASGDALLTDADHLLASVQTRLRRINTLSRWTQRWTAVVAGLRTELAHALAELDLARQELSYWRQKAAIAGITPDDVPPQAYLDAVRAPQPEECRIVAVLIDGEEWIVGLDRDRLTGADPLREANDWAALQATAREVRAELREDA